VAQGIATPQDVDIVVKTGFGRRYSAAGPFEIFDIAGWDLVLAVAQYLCADLESSTEIPAILKEKVETGQLGLKTEKGFYDWNQESAEALKRRIGQMLVKIAQLSQID
jgi:3-hydroxybutyryl-CoA dehydrogenase